MVTTVPAGMVVLLAVAGAVDFCVLLLDATTLLNPVLA
jgi:hypothetical protein